MGMHEIEGLVERSVLLLSKSRREDLRDLYKSLYDFQSNYDTGYTHFRVMDQLLSAGFVYRIPMEQHPDYSQYKPSLTALQGKSSGWAYLDPSQEWSEENPPTAYWEPPFLYFDAGTPLWKKLVKSGALVGNDAAPPKVIDANELAAIMVEQAERQNDIPLIAMWYAVAPNDYLMGQSKDDPSNDPRLKKIFEIVMRTEAYKLRNDYGLLRYPAPEDLAGGAETGEKDKTLSFLKTWFKPTW